MSSTTILYTTPEFTIEVPSPRSPTNRAVYLALYFLFLTALLAAIYVFGRRLRNLRAQRDEDRIEDGIEYWASVDEGVEEEEEEEDEEDSQAHEPLGGIVECLLVNEVGEVVGVQYNMGTGRDGGELPPRYEDVVGTSGP